LSKKHLYVLENNKIFKSNFNAKIMKTHSKNTNSVFTQFQILNIDSFPGYPLYPLNKDIYKRPSKIMDIDFEEISSK
jgi:hypothetical protein